jgi:dTDP-glucose 4,6-dehydratase
VYGPVTGGQVFPEWSPLIPSNPYSASKAAQEAIAIAYWRSYGVPVTIINCMNLIGQRQDGEKYLPTLIRLVSQGAEVSIHGSRDEIGTRFYLHARNLADALLFILLWAPPLPFPDADRPDRFNVVGPDRLSNLELAQLVAGHVGQPLKYRLVDFGSARPGHDAHYGLDGTKLARLGWKPPVPLEDSIRRIVAWTLNHAEWLEP